jgi:hypothetical protein
LAVRCDGCGYETLVTSRSRFGILEELHAAVCDVPGLTFNGTSEDVLRMPPYDPGSARER